MHPRSTLIRILAVLGAIAVWSPIVLMLGFTAIRFARARIFGMDYMIPGELFPLVIAGGGLLLFAAWRAGRRLRAIAWSFGVAVAALVLSQGLAVITGLASGETPAEGLPFIAVMALLALYDGAVISLGVGGALLVRDLVKRLPRPYPQ